METEETCYHSKLNNKENEQKL